MLRTLAMVQVPCPKLRIERLMCCVLYVSCVSWCLAVYRRLELTGIIRITAILAPQQLCKHKARLLETSTLPWLQTFVPQVICIASLRCFLWNLTLVR